MDWDHTLQKTKQNKKPKPTDSYNNDYFLLF